MADLNAPVTTIMTTRLQMVAYTIPLSFAAKLLVDKRIAGLPVTSEEGELRGVLAWRDVLVALQQEDDGEGAGFFEERPVVEARSGLDDLEGVVGDYMNTDLVTIATTATVGDAARRMAEGSVHRVLIVDERGNLAGLVSALDVVRHVVA